MEGRLEFMHDYMKIGRIGLENEMNKENGIVLCNLNLLIDKRKNWIANYFDYVYGI